MNKCFFYVLSVLSLRLQTKRIVRSMLDVFNKNFIFTLLIL